MKHFAIITWLF